MTSIIADNIDVDLKIGEYTDDDDEVQPILWSLVDAKVELTQAALPNYVDFIAKPQPQYSEQVSELTNSGNILYENPDGDGEIPFPNDGIANFVGEKFELNVDNNFTAVESESDNPDEQTIVTTDQASGDIEEDTLLFKGRLANISPIGTNLFEGLAYGPGQQAFNIGEEAGSILNKKLSFIGDVEFVSPGELSDNEDDVEGTPSQSFTVNRLIEEIIDETQLGNVDEAGNITSGNIERGNFEQEITIENSVITVKEALNRAKEVVYDESEGVGVEWWFDKSGTFHFEDPGQYIKNYNLNLIKDTSAGLQTPPYQSVQVVGSGIATSDGWNSSSLIQDDSEKIVQEANIALPVGQNVPQENDEGEVVEGGEVGALAEKIIVLDPDSDLQGDTFRYVNAELSTDRQVQNATIRIANELIKQQASGKVTVVGMPEVEIFDGIRMPNTDKQPMGGELFSVYKVVHKLNATDGFTTEIEVAGPSPGLIAEFGYRAETDDGEPGQPLIIPTSTDRDVYTPDGERRAFGPGAGEGDTDG